MRAIDRCKEHFQGDRCKKERMHAAETHPNRDHFHQGSFTAWSGEGDSKKVEAQTRPFVKVRRSRTANRVFRALCGKQANRALVGTKEAPARKALLQMVFDHFKGASRGQ
jgi:hypothetical protein